VTSGTRIDRAGSPAPRLLGIAFVDRNLDYPLGQNGLRCGTGGQEELAGTSVGVR